MSPAPEQPARGQVARSIAARIDWTPTVLAGSDPQVAIVEQVLRLAEYEAAAEVRALRAEQDRVVAAHARCDSAARALLDETEGRAVTFAEGRARADLVAALVARTPQPARTVRVGDPCSWAEPDDPHGDARNGVHEAGTGRDRGECRHCDEPIASAPLPAVPDGGDVPARLDAAAEVVAKLGFPGWAEDLRGVADEYRYAPDDVRAAVAAALATRPTEQQK